MNQLHAVVGVMIAIVANSWTGRIIPPFIWGVVWCGRLILLPSDTGSARHRNWTFLTTEYIKAVAGSLILSLVVGSAKQLFMYAILK